MKKTYNNPTTKIFTIQTAQMIAVSTGATFSGDGGSAGLNNRAASGAGLSREAGSFWDDDEE